MHPKVEQPVSSYTEFEKLAWVSTKAIPAIGSKLNVKINGIGESIVKKYFVEYGFIGMLESKLNCKIKNHGLWRVQCLIHDTLEDQTNYEKYGNVAFTTDLENKKK